MDRYTEVEYTPSGKIRTLIRNGRVIIRDMKRVTDEKKREE